MGSTKTFNGKRYTLYKKSITLKANANVFMKGLRDSKKLNVRLVKESSGYAIYTRSKARNR